MIKFRLTIQFIIKYSALLFVGVVVLSLAGNLNAQSRRVVLVVGAGGEEKFEQQFQAWADGWQTAIEKADEKLPKTDESKEEDSNPPESSNAARNENEIELVRIGSGDEEPSDREQLQKAIETTGESVTELWLILIGHGTDDRTHSKFNLRGKDVAADEINQWLKPVTGKVVVINCASASAGFIAKLKAPNRIVITSTKSPAQHNFARFGKYLSEAIGDPTLDLDKDDQTSLLEAFIAASSKTQDFYVQDSRLATELAMIDDNSDGKGTPADWFQGTRVVKKPKKGTADGLSANQVFLIRRGAERLLTEELRKRRDELEANLESLRSRKKEMSEASYYDSIEPLLIELAKIYREAEAGDADKENGK